MQRVISPRIKVLLAGVSSLILTMGVARFAYTPLLPVMMEQAGLTHAQGGWLAAINYIGYLVGVIAASFISGAVFKQRLYQYGMVVAAFTTVMMGLTTDLYIWALSRFFAGLSTATGMIIGSGLILNWLMREGHKRELGIHFSGVGFGIAVAAAAAIAMQTLRWDSQWYWLSGIACLLLMPALAWFPPLPSESKIVKQSAHMQQMPPSKAFMRLFLVAYCCAGFGYVITATFIVAITNDIPALANQGSWIFLIIGLVGAPSCIVWDLIARKTGDVNALLLAGLIEVVGIIMPTLGLGMLGALIGAVLYGATCIAIVSLVLTMAGRYYPAQPAKMMSKMTIAYGIAQIVGPALTGSLADYYGGYEIGLMIAAVVMLIGCVFFYCMRGCDKQG